MSSLLGIIGYPLRHSISHAFQQAALDHLGLSMRYHVWETQPESLEERVHELARLEVVGFNVTVPHKKQILQFMGELSPEAAAIGTVNTVLKRGDVFCGYNTDSYGFIRALQKGSDLDLKGLDVLLLGAGGAAHAVAFAVASLGAARISIANRTVEKARTLAAAVSRLGPHTEALTLERKDLEAITMTGPGSGPGLIVNCTSLGMLHSQNEDASPIPADLIPPGTLAYDLVYNPPMTPFLRAAQNKGVKILGGLSMLVYQGANSFQLWTGHEPPIEVMFSAARAALSHGETS